MHLKILRLHVFSEMFYSSTEKQIEHKENSNQEAERKVYSREGSCSRDSASEFLHIQFFLLCLFYDIHSKVHLIRCMNG